MKAVDINFFIFFYLVLLSVQREALQLQWNLRNPATDYSNILWHPTNIYIQDENYVNNIKQNTVEHVQFDT